MIGGIAHASLRGAISPHNRRFRTGVKRCFFRLCGGYKPYPGEAAIAKCLCFGYSSSRGETTRKALSSCRAAGRSSAPFLVWTKPDCCLRQDKDFAHGLDPKP